MKLKIFLLALLFAIQPLSHGQGQQGDLDEGVEYSGIFNAEVGDDGMLIVSVSRIARKVNPYHKSDNAYQRTEWVNYSQQFEIMGLGASKIVTISKKGEKINLYELIDPKVKKGPIDIICLTCSQSLPPDIASEFDISRAFRLRSSVEEIRLNVNKYRTMIEDRSRQRAKDIADKKNKEQQEMARKNREGDDSEEDKTCKKFGYKYPSTAYSDCRLKIELAQREAADRRLEFDAQMKVYRAQQAEYEEKNRIYQESLSKEAKRVQAQRSLDMGLRMMGGQSPQDAYLSIGTGAPIAPLAPQPSTLPRTYRMPDGRSMSCTTLGSITTCN